MFRVIAQGEAPSLADFEAALEAAANNADWSERYPAGFEHRFADGVPMVLVPAGCYQMGNDPASFFWDGVRWQQGVPDGGQICFATPFWIDKTEVTQEQFDRLDGVASRNVYFEGAQRPRVNVSWFEARDFCALRGEITGAAVRLPTEAEWEYAARGTAGYGFPWGNEWDGEKAISHRGYDLAIEEVATISAGASWVGAFDMSGNVWEWVATTYLQYPYPVDAAGTPQDESLLVPDDHIARRGMRGGSWNNSYPEELRATYRHWGVPDYANLAIGFRCIRLDPQ